jgi:preprotein translocase SecE subunit
MLTLAKATSKDKGATARTRAAGTPVGAKASTIREASDEPVRDEEELQAEESPDVEDAVEIDEPEERTDLVARDTVERDVAVAPSQAPARVARVPEWALGNPLTRFIAESYLELRKVTWPTFQQAWTMTLVVIAMSAVVALILSVADLGLARFLTWFLSLSTGG